MHSNANDSKICMCVFTIKTNMVAWNMAQECRKRNNKQTRQSKWYGIDSDWNLTVIE